MSSAAGSRSRWIGDKAFYQKVLALLIPMIIQQGITNFVNLLDNVMVGQLGTEPISGVAVANQLIFVFNLMIFGLFAGASIFGAQFFGKGDYEGFHETVRYRILVGMILAALGWAVFGLFGDTLYALYLGGTEEALTIYYAGRYMRIICWQLFPFVLVQGVGGALKDCGETRMPMQASVLAIFTNLILNYLLIYGKFGFPELGIEGAAIATVIARFLELLFLIVQVSRNLDKLTYMHGILSSMKITGVVLKKMLITGTPLFANETLWSVGLTLINSCYAIRGIQAVAATNINSTCWNLFGVICLAMGNAVGILSGQCLGANDFEGAKDTVRKVIVMGVGLNILVGIIVFIAASYIPYMYNTEPEVRQLATNLLRVVGIMMPVSTYTNICYFTLRSGGKTIITFFFDCGFTWVASLPLAWILCHHTNLGVLQVYVAGQSLEFIKIVTGTILLKSGIWINNVLPDEDK